MRTKNTRNSAIHASPSKASANSKNQFSMERSPVGREHGHVESGIVWGISRNASYSASKRLSVIYTCIIMCMYIYIYHIMFGDVLCLVSQSISPPKCQTSQTKYIKYTKTVQDSSQSSFIFGNSHQVIFPGLFFGFPNPALCKVWGFNATAPAPLRGAVYRCHRHRALIFHLWTSQRLGFQPDARSELVQLWRINMGVSKNRGVSPKMDGENNGKPYFQMDDLGGKPPIFGNTHICDRHWGRKAPFCRNLFSGT